MNTFAGPGWYRLTRPDTKKSHDTFAADLARLEHAVGKALGNEDAGILDRAWLNTGQVVHDDGTVLLTIERIQTPRQRRLK